MTESATLVDHLGAQGPGAPPRSNGELIFAEPWESRAFGMAIALADAGAFTLADFQQSLIGAIGEWESLGTAVESFRYYECWLVALERLVASNLPVASAEIDRRVAEFGNRPADHDHDHGDHDHVHGDHDHGAHSAHQH